MAVVRQLNMVPMLAATATITSFVTPYCCPGCGHETSKIFEPQEIVDGEAPSVCCRMCRQPMELDDVPGEYFAFLTEFPA